MAKPQFLELSDAEPIPSAVTTPAIFSIALFMSLLLFVANAL